jgi:hypothetical protein
MPYPIRPTRLAHTSQAEPDSDSEAPPAATNNAAPTGSREVTSRTAPNPNTSVQQQMRRSDGDPLVALRRYTPTPADLLVALRGFGDPLVALRGFTPTPVDRLVAPRRFGDPLVEPGRNVAASPSAPSDLSSVSSPRRRMVDAVTGRPVPPGTPGAISASAFRNRRQIPASTSRSTVSPEANRRRYTASNPPIAAAFGADGILFTRQNISGFSDLTEATNFWHDLAPQPASSNRVKTDVKVWDLLPRDLDLLRQFLGQLRQTADYEHGASRPRLAARVRDLLHAMEQSAELRRICSDCISDALQTCGDRVILAMNQVETAVRVHQAEHGDPNGAALKELVLGFMRLDIVQAQARHKVTTLLASRPRTILDDPDANHGIDEIEVFLAYEAGLREILKLPVSAENMLYSENVTKADLEAARQVVESAMQDPGRVAAYLKSSAPWQRHERREMVKQWSWQSLTPTPWPEGLRAEELKCPITLENFADLSQPVLCPSHGTWHAYEASALLTHWVEHGTDIFHQNLELTSLNRPEMDAEQSTRKKLRLS